MPRAKSGKPPQNDNAFIPPSAFLRNIFLSHHFHLLLSDCPILLVYFLSGDFCCMHFATAFSSHTTLLLHFFATLTVLDLCYIQHSPPGCHDSVHVQCRVLMPSYGFTEKIMLHIFLWQQ